MDKEKHKQYQANSDARNKEMGIKMRRFTIAVADEEKLERLAKLGVAKARAKYLAKQRG